MTTVPFPPEPGIPSIDVETLAQKLTAETEDLQLIDVRETWEVETAAIAGFQNLPLSQSQIWAEQIHNQFAQDVETVVMCHHGMRSAQMCQWLISQGFKNVKNLSGGIDAYSSLVDPSIPRY